MKHLRSFRKLNRHAAHRRALLSNMANALLRHYRITTTLAKAKELRRVVERLVTKARSDTLAARRQVLKVLRRPDNLKRLFKVIAPAFAGRPGGYTRIIRLGRRSLDNAEMARIEFVAEFAPPPSADRPKAEEKGAKRPRGKAEQAAKAAKAGKDKPKPS